MKARDAVKRAIEDSNFETDAHSPTPKKRRRIKPSRLDSTSSEDELPIKRNAAVIPPPPPVSNQPPVKVRKGQGPSKDELRKQQREELMKRIKAAKDAAAAKMSGVKMSPWKITVSRIISM